MPLETALNPGSEVLLLEDDAALRKRLAAHLRQLGAEVTEAGNLAEARRLLHGVRFDFALVDLHLPDGEVLELLREGAFSENTGIVVMTAFGGIKQAVEAIRLGASDYLSKPFELDELQIAFARCRQSRKADRREEHRRAETAADAEQILFGTSLAAIHSQLTQIIATERRLVRRLPPVLIEGETGTGKSVLARWLHREGPRAAQPFIAVNCAALPDSLAEAELFGHERGAFTDAKRARLGLFEAADGGTLFLDEVASLSLPTQAKLLTAIEDGKIRRLGGTREISIDVRLITASNRPLDDLAAQGAFREDLYHRLNLLRLTLPPLRERGADILPLAHHLLAQLGTRHRLKNLRIPPAGETRLAAYRWPGNVRELAHELERAIIFSGGRELDFATLGGAPDSAHPASAAPANSWRNPAWRLPETGFSIDAAIDELIAEALRETDGNVSAAARRLGVTREFLRYRLDAQKPQDA
ncbi:sigma-54-dependent transcriptional regulator [Oleiharenicola lentus]|uniref:sigma-54-dependent transcriptional regulator n=1 Tax=Oleiharenicola lentus TaxID=2508720 RepID=UPI003F6788C2